MDEKERQTIEEEETALVSAEAGSEEAELEEETLEEAEEDGKHLYMGRFTAGTWHGGILGIALSYFLTGLLGIMDTKFSLGIRTWLENPIFKYGLLILLCYGLGKLGGYLEKRREAEENQEN